MAITIIMAQRPSAMAATMSDCTAISISSLKLRSRLTALSIRTLVMCTTTITTTTRTRRPKKQERI